MTLEDLTKRLQTRKEVDLGSEKQRRPLEAESRETGAAAEGNKAERGRAKLRQLPMAES